MADVDTFTVKLAELLRTPDDLDKIPALKAEYTRKKAAVDSQLKAGLKEQLEVTQSGMNAISESQRIVNQIKEEMMKIDKLCAESQNMIREFPHINEVSTIHRNISLVETMKQNIDEFHDRLQRVQDELLDDEADLENQPNLLKSHYELTKLREIRDDAMDQIRQSPDESLEGSLQDHFQKLDEVVDIFDSHIGEVSVRLLDLIQEDNKSLVVRLALIIEEEEKNDMKVKAMQDAQKEHKALASRFKSMKSGPRQVRGYKEKFLQAIELVAQQKFDAAHDGFMEDSSKLGKQLRWFFNDLKAVKEGMVELMPKKWKIYRTYTSIYHRTMHDWLIKIIDDDNTSSMHILAIIHWREKYYANMGKLGWSPADLQPDILDDREGELVRDWRQLIVSKMEEWMGRMFSADKSNFLARSEDALEKDANGYFRTKTLPDMWRMLREQTTVAAGSDRGDVMEGVLDEMFRALKRRQASWTRLIADETDKYTRPGADGSTEGFNTLQDWLVALANDQISCIDDNEDDPNLPQGYLTGFRNDYTRHVGGAYAQNSGLELAAIRDGYVDLSTFCVRSFSELIFAVDLKSTVGDFFTPKWFTEYGMKRITSTFEDYAADYAELLHRSLVDILYEELSERLLVRYLLAVRNKSARFRRQDPFKDKIGDDVQTAWAFLGRYAGWSVEVLQQRWRPTHHLVRLLEDDKSLLPGVYEDFRREYWDLQLGWVESVLRSRDDYDRGMWNAVKQRAAEVYVERGPETVMSKVK